MQKVLKLGDTFNNKKIKINDKEEYSNIIAKAQKDLLEKKKMYAKNLSDWILSCVKNNLKFKAIKAAKNGYSEFTLCNFFSEKSNWYGRYLWRFTWNEMKGPLRQFWYEYNSKRYTSYHTLYSGPFFDVETYLKEKCNEMSQNIPYTLKYEIYESPDNDLYFSIVASLKP